jgi:dihydrofolate reductase
MSKVILYMAITLNGYIANKEDDTSWISGEEWSSYSQMVQKAGNLIVGHRTYDILTKQPEFAELEKVKLIVVSNKDFQTISTNHLIARTPKKALELLKDYDEVIVAGGGILNASFMKENLIDEIYIDIEPSIIGKGIKLFVDEDFESSLKLLEINKITENEIQLHYAVKK